MSVSNDTFAVFGALYSKSDTEGVANWKTKRSVENRSLRRNVLGVSTRATSKLIERVKNLLGDINTYAFLNYSISSYKH